MEGDYKMRLSVQWPLVLFTLIAGAGGSLYLFMALPIVFGIGAPQWYFPIGIVSAVLMVIGGLCSAGHLKQISHSMHVISHLFTFTGIAIEAMLLGLVIVLDVVSMYLVYVGFDMFVQRIVAGVGVVAAIFLCFYCGHGYVMPSRPEWRTNFLPLAYMGTSLATGGFLYALFQGISQATEAEFTITSMAAILMAVVCACACAGYCIRVRTAVFNSQACAIDVKADMAREGEEERIHLGQKNFKVLAICGTAGAVICAALLAAFPFAELPIAILGLVVTLAAGLSVRTLMWQVGRCYLPLFDLCDVGITV
jgi:DMSO reductase anchor subunit